MKLFITGVFVSLGPDMMKTNRFSFLAGIALLLLGCMGSLQSAPPDVIAHRGASGYLPEHTLEAVSLAYGMRADFIEQDLVLTKDDIPVVLHDITIDTVTDVDKKFPDRKRADGRYYAIDFTLAELKQLNAHERIDYKTGHPSLPGRFPLNQLPFKIPTFEEELQLIAGLNKSTGKSVGIYPELKQAAWHRKQGHDLSAIVIPVLHRYGYKTKADQCWIQCFELDEVRRVRRELGWEGRLLLLLGAGRPTSDGFQFKEIRTPDDLPELSKTIDGLGPAFASILGPDNKPTTFTAQAHAQNLIVHPYTVRADSLPKGIGSVEELHRLLFVEAGIDGVFTDFPDKTAAFVRGMQGK